MAKKTRKYPSQKRRKKRRRTRRSSKMPKGLLKTAIALAALFSAVFFGQWYYQELHRIAIADTANLETPSQDTQTFIQTIGEDARYIAAQNDLYASVMIAQAILESNSGQSALSQAPNYNFLVSRAITMASPLPCKLGKMTAMAMPTPLMPPFALMIIPWNLWKIMPNFFKKISMQASENPIPILTKVPRQL